MATYTASILTTSSFVSSSNLQPQLYGSDGEKLSEKIAAIKKDVKKDEPLQRLLQQLKRPNDERHSEIRAYLDSLFAEAISTETEFTTHVLDSAWQVWEKLRNYFSLIGLCLEVPDACPGKNNNFMYTWSKAEHYFECEIFDTGEVEFFYRNRNISDVWGEDTTLGQQFSAAILEKASLFTW